MCIRKNSCCLHKKIKGDILPFAGYFSPIFNTQQMLKLDIKKLPSTVKWAPPQPHPFSSLEIPNLYFKAVFETLQLWTKVQRRFFCSLNVTVWSSAQNQPSETWRLLLFLKQVPGIFCLDVAEVFLRGFFEEQQTNAKRRRIQPGFEEIQNVKYCLMLAFKKMLERTPEQQSPPARPGPHPAKADQCQHRCFNVHNIYKFINL